MDRDTNWLIDEYAKATEWNLATLEELATLKSSSNSRIRRQEQICRSMLNVLSAYKPKDYVAGYKLIGRHLRTLRVLYAPVSVDEALAQLVTYYVDTPDVPSKKPDWYR